MTQTAEGIYKRLEAERESYLTRAREVSALTIPHLFPDDDNGLTNGTELPEPYHSIGARAVNNLASKMMLALFPPNDKFFRLSVDEGALEEAEQFENVRSEIEDSLADIEDIVLDEIESPTTEEGPRPGMRTQLFPIMQQLIVAGNVLFHVPATRPSRWFRLDSYVVERDPRDQIQHIVIKQRVSQFNLPEAVKKVAGVSQDDFQPGDNGQYVTVYTWVQRTKDGWVEHNEVNGKQVSGTVKHKLSRLPYLALRMYRMDGESYGHGQGTEFLPDFRTLNALEKDIIEFAAASARLIGLVDPSGMTEIKDLNDAPNGSLVAGREQDVVILQANKLNDFSVVRQERVDIEKRIGLAFLLNSTVPRQAERVTAEEIRLIASELEDTLGGVYSLQSADLQLPLVTILLGNMQDLGKIPELPEAVKPKIVTGLDAIGRGHELARLDEFVRGLVELFGPQAINILNPSEYARERKTALGIKNDKIIRTEEEIQQQRQAEQSAAIAEKVSPEVMKQIGPQIASGLTNGAA